MDAEDEDALHYEMEEEEKKVTVHETVFSRVLRDSTPRFVGPSVRHTFTFLYYNIILLRPF